MLQLLCYPILKQFVFGVHIGVDGDDRDLFLLLNKTSGELSILECKDAKYLETEIGKIYYYFSREKNSQIIKKYELKSENVDEWITYFNTLVYATMFNLIPANPPYDPKSEERIMSFEIRDMSLDIEDEEFRAGIPGT